MQQFLLTNLVVPPASSPDKVKFQVPLSILKDSIPALGSFPYEPGERSWSGKTLVVKGSKSKQVPSLSINHINLMLCRYINRHNTPVLKTFFPNARLEELEAGHWGKPICL